MIDSIQKAKNGSKNAFGDLYDISYDRIYTYIFHRTLDTTETEDIMSEVFMKVMKSIGKFRGSTEGEYYSWLFQIAYTTIIDRSREAIGIDSLEEIVWEPSVEEDNEIIDKKDKLDEVTAYLKTLTEKERSIITMRIWDDLSYEEIAQITAESEANIRKIVSRTLAKIAANVSPLVLFLFLLPHV